MAATSIGDLRERIELQQIATSRDAIGGEVQAWSTLTTCWAEVRQASNSETWRRQQMQASAGWTITVRYRADLTPQHRILWRNRTFQIRGMANPDMRKRFLVIAAEEIAATVLQ